MSGLHTLLQEKFGSKVLETHDHRGDETAVVTKEALMEIMTYLRDDSAFKFNVLMDLTAVDGLEMKWKPRFQVVYHLYSTEKNHRLRIKVGIELKDCSVPSVFSIWPAANWFEREVWDMFGIRFEGHPDLRRILMYTEFEGHPLRKDYPYNKRQPLIGPGAKVGSGARVAESGADRE